MSYDGDSVSEVARMVLKRAREEEEEDASKWLYLSLDPIIAIRRTRVPVVAHPVRYCTRIDDYYLTFSDCASAVQTVTTTAILRRYGQIGKIFLLPDDERSSFEDSIKLFQTGHALYCTDGPQPEEFMYRLKQLLGGDIYEVDEDMERVKGNKKKRKTPTAPPFSPGSPSYSPTSPS